MARGKSTGGKEALKKQKFGRELLWASYTLTRIMICSHLVHNILLKRKDKEEEDAMSFIIGSQEIYFGEREFAMMSGLKFQGTDEIVHKPKEIPLMKVHFPGKDNVKLEDLIRKFRKLENNNEDKLKLGLFAIVEGMIKRHDTRRIVDKGLFLLVDNLEEFNSYPWGKLFYKATRDSLIKASKKKDISKAKDTLGKVVYDLDGFPHVFQAWIFESIPSLKHKYTVENKSCPQALHPRILHMEMPQTRTNAPSHEQIRAELSCVDLIWTFFFCFADCGFFNFTAEEVKESYMDGILTEVEDNSSEQREANHCSSPTNSLIDEDQDVRSLENLKLKMRSEIELLNKKKYAVANDVGLLNKNREELETGCCKLTDDKTVLNKEKLKLGKEIESLNRKKTKLGTDTDLLNKEKTKLQKDFELLKKEQSTVQDDVCSLNEKKTYLESEIGSLSNEKTNIRNETEFLKKQQSTVQDDVCLLNERKAILEIEIGPLRNEETNLRNEIELLNKKKMKLQRDFELLKKEQSTVQDDVCSLNEKKAILEIEIGSLNNVKTNIGNETEFLHKEKVKLQSDFELLKKEQKIESLSYEKTNLRNDNQFLDKEKTRLQTETEFFNKGKMDLRSDYEFLDQEKAKLGKDVEKLKERKCEMETDFGFLQNQKNKLHSDIETLNKEKDKLQSDIEYHNEENASFIRSVMADLNKSFYERDKTLAENEKINTVIGVKKRKGGDPELWNFREKKKATLKEGISFQLNRKDK
ncbi:hypothetical protein MKX03_023992 [Papaver bracteatum]|nr:hypothetical protein MKX03_023992 [Papaver bracteatum]